MGRKMMIFVHVCALVCGWVLLMRWRDGRAMPRQAPCHSVSVIIPARNEAKNLARLLPALRAQSMAAREIIVVDDGSTDDTAAVAHTFHARVVHAPPLPHGWLGKSWACAHGARCAHGALFLFLDADTLPEPTFLAAMHDTWMREGGWLTVQPYHAVERPYEHISALLNIAVVMGSAQFSPFVHPRRAFGPCAMCHSTDYVRMGGHEAIAHHVLEHMALGSRFAAHGLPTPAYGGRHLISFRMYPDGLRDALTGWTKSIALGAGSTALLPLIMTGFWVSGLLGIAIDVALIHSGKSAVVSFGMYGCAVASVAWMLRKVGAFPWYVSVLYPLYTVVFVGIVIWAAFRSFVVRRVSWKGRDISVRTKEDVSHE